MNKPAGVHVHPYHGFIFTVAKFRPKLCAPKQQIDNKVKINLEKTKIPGKSNLQASNSP